MGIVEHGVLIETVEVGSKTLTLPESASAIYAVRQLPLGSAAVQREFTIIVTTGEPGPGQAKLTGPLEVTLGGPVQHAEDQFFVVTDREEVPDEEPGPAGPSLAERIAILEERVARLEGAGVRPVDAPPTGS